MCSVHLHDLYLNLDLACVTVVYNMYSQMYTHDKDDCGLVLHCRCTRTESPPVKMSICM